MRPLLSAFAAGALFALGLGVAGMTLPSRVIGFLDVTGAWDPTLAFVMIGAIGTHLSLLRIILRRTGPIFGVRFEIPTRRDLDGKLVAGAALFGIGWGLAGYCPGPALTSIVTLTPAALIVVAAMAAGMLLQNLTAGLPPEA